MSNRLVKNGSNGQIVNPFARPVLTLSVDDQFQSNLQAPDLHPTQVVKILMNVMFDVMFGYIDAVTKNMPPKGEESESQIIQ
ncbi:hypothetical protein HOO68_05740 [Candidatus Gracilibacteria bacterium]|nr:hypothetical protein [Candidatus Gracilibacteria bacterium]